MKRFIILYLLPLVLVEFSGALFLVHAELLPGNQALLSQAALPPGVWPDDDIARRIDPALGTYFSVMANHLWDVTTVFSSRHQTWLITGCFKGRPGQLEGLAEVPASWSLLISNTANQSLRPQWLHWHAGWVALKAEPASNGFMVTFYDMPLKAVRYIHLDGEGQFWDVPLLPEEPEPVVQPEDMPEGTGG